MSNKIRGLKAAAAPITLAVVAAFAASGCSDDGDATGSCGAEFGAKVNALVDASGDLEAVAGTLTAEVAVACAHIAGESEPSDPTPEDVDSLCGKAQATIKAELMAAGSLTITSSPGYCTVDADAQFNCEASCSVEGMCDPGTVEARCDPGELSVQCEGACSAGATCQGSAEVAANCEGECSGTCEGTCEGMCDGQASTGGGSGGECNGACDGTCKGTCKGECKLDANANIECGAEARCKGECMGTAKAPQCEAKLEPPMCDLDADCQAGCEGQASLKAECVPPTVEIVAEGEVDAEFISTLEAELPAILNAFKVQGELAVRAGENFVGAISGLAEGAVQVGPACVAAVTGKIEAAVSGAVDASASVNVSVMASASVSAEAGAS